MKLNLEIELDWIDEESNLDETVKAQIIQAVVNKIEKQVLDKVEKKVNDIIDKTVVKKIDKMTEKIFNDFINKEISLTDNYGSVIKTYPSVIDVIKERFDNFMTQKVDDRGNTTTSNYGTTYQRLTFIIDKQLKDFSEKFTQDAVKQVSEEIKMHVHNGLTTKLGAELMKVLKVDKMLQLTNGK